MVILLGLMRIVDFLVVLELVTGVAFTFHTSALEMWSTIFEAWSRFFSIFYFLGMEISSGVALSSFLSSTKSTDITEAIFHGFPIGTSVSCYSALQL